LVYARPQLSRDPLGDVLEARKRTTLRPLRVGGVLLLLVGAVGLLSAALTLSPLPYEEMGLRHVPTELNRVDWQAANSELRGLNRSLALLALPMNLAFAAAGYGLLRLRPWARSVSVVVILVASVGAIALPWLPLPYTAAASVFHALGETPPPPPPVGVRVFGSLFLLAASAPAIWFCRYLTRPDVRALF
jgi:hypothetical protein